MESVGQDVVKNIAQALRSSYPKHVIKKYSQTVRRYIRICHLHGPYQAAALLNSEITTADGRERKEQSQKELLHEHLLLFLEQKENAGALTAVLSQEEDSVRCLDNIFHMIYFLKRISAELEEGDTAS